MIRFWKVVRAINAWEDDAREFVYGETDCCRFAAFVIHSITGIDRFPPELKYGSRAEAYALIKKHGTLQNIVSHYLGDPVDVDTLRPGDPVLAELPTVGELLGIKTPGLVVVPAENRGLISLSDSCAITGWAV